MPAPSSGDGRGIDRGDAANGDSTGGPELTRRSMLAGTGVAIGAGAVGAAGFAGASGVAAGQITEAAAIPEVTRWENDNIAGFMIHVGGSTSPAQVRIAEDCDVPGSDTWPPDTMLAYEVHLINRKTEGTPEEEETTLYIGDSAEVAPGTLYIINRFNRCGSGFVGVTLEQIGRSDIEVDGEADGGAGGGQATVATTEPGDGGGFGSSGPGFGALAALAGLAGGGALLRWRDTEE
ncbi:PGF-CTERM sorting domain-containing protein [Halosimplex sp. TS25]|uniref:PGF-CTERM sorting domain-containing protein n=1 Tax=Halosimplex rarum TaxID=3396619 RepID=UPI0039EAF85E